jgi:diguanylate cyclase (GGDEF)-like protein
MTFVEAWMPLWAALASAGILLSLILGVIWVKSRQRGRTTIRQDAATGLPSTYDAITGLPTDRLFKALLGQAVTRSAKMQSRGALLLVRTKELTLSDSSHTSLHSHMLSRVIAARVKGAIRSSDTVARITSDTLAAIIENIRDVSDVTRVGHKMQEVLTLPLCIEGTDFLLTCHVGVAFYPDDGADRESILQRASEALRMACTNGQAVVCTSASARIPAGDSPSLVPSLSTR